MTVLSESGSRKTEDEMPSLTGSMSASANYVEVEPLDSRLIL
jgi:hypothetical protein